MTRLRIRHETMYEFESPTAFGAWRLQMRPVDTHAVRILEASLELSPPGATRWGFDAYGNCVCLYQPAGEAALLRVVNHLLLERYPASLDIEIDASVVVDDAESKKLVLAPFWIPVSDNDDAGYRAWLTSVAPREGEPPLEFVKRLNTAIHSGFGYEARESEGVQSPAETVARGLGACRDLAWLMIETLRRFGHPARFASGYIYSEGAAMQGAGATHAWAEVFLSALGWLEFDPTNGIAESRDLIRVAATRTPEEAAPMRGATLSPVRAQMRVAVDVSRAD